MSCSVRDVANQFKTIDADTATKGDREMSVCEMQAEYETRNIARARTRTATACSPCGASSKDRRATAARSQSANAMRQGRRHRRALLQLRSRYSKYYLSSPIEPKRAEAADAADVPAAHHATGHDAAPGHDQAAAGHREETRGQPPRIRIR